MSEARRLLERAVMGRYGDSSWWHEARAYLAQPITKCEELLNELHHFHELTGMDGIEFEKALDEATGLRDWTGTPNGAMFLALLAREGELVAALEPIVFGLRYDDFGDEDWLTWERCVRRWEDKWKPALQEEHFGDCTKQPTVCFRCQAEDVVRVARLIRAALTAGKKKKSEAT